jgi:hypothetical protein
VPFSIPRALFEIDLGGKAGSEAAGFQPAFTTSLALTGQTIVGIGVSLLITLPIILGIILLKR